MQKVKYGPMSKRPNQVWSLIVTYFNKIKETWTKKREGAAKNPFDRGNCFNNCCFTLCAIQPPSLIKRREYASEEQVRAYEESSRRRPQNGSMYESAAEQVRQ